MICIVFNFMYIFFFFKQKTAYEMRISDWSSDVCSSDLEGDQVKKGDLLMRIRPEIYVSTVNQMAAALNQARSNIAGSQARVTQLQAQLEGIDRKSVV